MRSIISSLASPRSLLFTSTISSHQASFSNAPQSNHAKFRQISPNHKIVAYLKSIGCGIPDKSKRKTPMKRERGGLDRPKDGMHKKRDKNIFRAVLEERRPQKALSQSSEPGVKSVKMWKKVEPCYFLDDDDANVDFDDLESLGSFDDDNHAIDLDNDHDYDDDDDEDYNDANSDSNSKNNKKFVIVNPVFPKPDYNEVAIFGRSNVGKSTFINAILYGGSARPPVNPNTTRGKTPDSYKLPKGPKAFESAKPGTTRSIDFYQLVTTTPQKTKNGLTLVDLPGYGFSYGADADSNRNKKNKPFSSATDGVGTDLFYDFIESYVVDRCISINSASNKKPLKRIILLLDSRHGLKRSDIVFLRKLEENYLARCTTKAQIGNFPQLQIVMTKCDLVSRADLARRIMLVEDEIKHALRREYTGGRPIMCVVAKAGVRGAIKHGAGVREVQNMLSTLSNDF
ncbi:hypothetical protein ScalyP_jg9740 [Parmales sp. scaly parma]|nr:hypothetical protein ScalyP_jg9740 [Parmales sp. scaly parma]